jgi:hypothetical protein
MPCGQWGHHSGQSSRPGAAAHTTKVPFPKQQRTWGQQGDKGVRQHLSVLTVQGVRPVWALGGDAQQVSTGFAARQSQEQPHSFVRKPRAALDGVPQRQLGTCQPFSSLHTLHRSHLPKAPQAGGHTGSVWLAQRRPNKRAPHRSNAEGRQVKRGAATYEVVSLRRPSRLQTTGRTAKLFN